MPEASDWPLAMVCLGSFIDLRSTWQAGKLTVPAVVYATLGLASSSLIATVANVYSAKLCRVMRFPMLGNAGCWDQPDPNRTHSDGAPIRSLAASSGLRD